MRDRRRPASEHADLLVHDDLYTGPALEPTMIKRAEDALGVRLPTAYLRLLGTRNGGRLIRPCVPTAFPTSWALDHFRVTALLGVGGSAGIETEAGSRYLVAEWQYPDVGVVVADTPSGGHDTVMLDYSECGPSGEPSVVYVDEDRVPRRVAQTFGEFLGLLTDCPED